MIMIDDLNRAREVLIGNIPDPFRSIAYGDLLFGVVPTALASFQIEAQTKLLGRFNRSNVGSRTGTAEDKHFGVVIGAISCASELYTHEYWPKDTSHYTTFKSRNQVRFVANGIGVFVIKKE